MEESKNTFGRKSITPKTKKLHPRVDLTAMVSVSFLLIVFFMLTSFLSRSNAMALGMPESRGCGGYGGGGCGDGATRSIVLLLGDNNKLISYVGHFSIPLEGPKELNYGKNSLRYELMLLKNKLLRETGRDSRIVIIKPSKKSNYKNLVDVLDEMSITKVPTYAVIDITPEEEALLANK